MTESAPARITGLNCPHCGGALEAQPGRRVETCPYCQTPLLAVGELGIQRFAVEPQSTAAAAAVVARQWLESGWNKDPGVKQGAEIVQPMLCFLPFFRVQADALGYALGTEERGSGKNRHEVDVEKRTQASCDRTYPAVSVAEWGVESVGSGGYAMAPFSAEDLRRQGMVFVATGSEAEVHARALALFRHEVDPTKSLKRTRFNFLVTLRERVSVLFYPFWVVRYRYRSRSYQILVDANGGKIAYGKAPGSDFYRAAMLVLSEAAACFVATTVFRLAFSSGTSGTLALLAIGAGLGWAILSWGWKRFRYGGVVIEGSGVVSDPYERGDRGS